VRVRVRVRVRARVRVRVRVRVTVRVRVRLGVSCLLDVPRFAPDVRDERRAAVAWLGVRHSDRV